MRQPSTADHFKVISCVESAHILWIAVGIKSIFCATGDRNVWKPLLFTGFGLLEKQSTLSEHSRNVMSVYIIGSIYRIQFAKLSSSRKLES